MRSVRSGTRLTSWAPSTAPGIDPTAMAMPTRKCTLPKSACSTTPGMARIVTAMSDVPLAFFMGRSMSERNSGTMMKPPPTPT